jgi:hypothetical protein
MTTPSMLRRLALLSALVAGASACADKELTPTQAKLSPRLSLQITATGLPSQVGASPLYLLTGAIYAVPEHDNRDGQRLLAVKWTRIVQGSQQVTLPVDIAPCLADASRLGSKDGCSMYIAAIITPDSVDVASDTGDVDPIRTAFDYAFPVGPFDVVPGRTPVIPPIDLSLSRFGVVNWQKDDPLRVGGQFSPSAVGSVQGGLAAISGVAGGTGAPVLFAPSFGSELVTPGTSNTPPVFANYPQLAIFQNGSWRRVSATTAPTGTAFRAVTALAENDVYIAASNGLYRYDGTTISRVTAVTDSLFGVAHRVVGTAKYVIASGINGAVWIGNTTTWQRYGLPSNSRFDGACITGPNEAFVSSVLSGEIYRFDGTNWLSAPGPTTAGKLDLQCPAPGQAFVLTLGGPLLKWSGTGWTQMPTTGIGPGRLIRWGVTSPTEIYAWADSAANDRAYYRFDGSTWTEIGRTRFTQAAARPWADPRGGAAYVWMQFGRLERVTPSGFTVLTYQPALRDAVMTSPTSAFVVGWNNFLARWNGSTWTVDRPPAGIASFRVLQSVWSDGPSNAWAVGSAGTILRFNGSAWSVVSDSMKPVVSASEMYNGVWGSGSDVWIAGDNGITRCRAGGSCAMEQQASGVYGIWGTSPTSIFAVGAGGKILRYNGTSWTTMSSPTSRLLVRLSGTSASDVWAVGDSVVVHFDGTQWADVSLGGNPGYMRSRAPSPLQALFQIGIWARTPKEVYLGSDYGMIARWDGTEWREVFSSTNTPQRRIIAITGGAGGCAIAITEGQTNSTQPTLWRGVGPSGCLAAPMTPPAIWP